MPTWKCNRWAFLNNRNWFYVDTGSGQLSRSGFSRNERFGVGTGGREFRSFGQLMIFVPSFVVLKTTRKRFLLFAETAAVDTEPVSLIKSAPILRSPRSEPLRRLERSCWTWIYWLIGAWEVRILRRTPKSRSPIRTKSKILTPGCVCTSIWREVSPHTS